MAFNWKVLAVSQDRVTIEIVAAGITRSFTFEGIETDKPIQALQQIKEFGRAAALGLRLEAQRSLKPTPAAAILSAIGQIQAPEED